MEKKRNVIRIWIMLIFFSIISCQKEELPIVEKSATPDLLPVNLVYPTPIKTLQHKLTLTGSSTVLAINANNFISKACRDNLGAAHFRIAWADDSRSFYNTANTAYIFNSGCETSLKSLNLPLTRIYNIVNEAGGIHNTLDNLANVCNKLGNDQGKIILCLESAIAKNTLDVSVYKDAVNYAKSKGYGFKYWEISNEPQYAWGSGLTDPVSYAQHVKTVYDAIKAIDPNMIVGCQICRKSYFSDQVLSNIAGKADFIAGHWYGITSADKFSTTDLILGENYKDLSYIAYENQNILDKTGKQIPQIDTEWRLYADGTVNGTYKTAEMNDKNANIIGTLFQAVRLIYCIRDNYTQGACTWHTQGAQPGVLVPSGWLNSTNMNGKTSYLYWLYYYMINNTGENVMDFSGSAPSYSGTANHNVDATASDESVTGPLTPVMITSSADGTKIFITVVNGSDAMTVPFSANLQNFTITSQSAVRISDTDLNQLFYQANNSRFVSTPAISNSQGIISCSLPPLSCTFITLTGTRTAQPVPTNIVNGKTYAIIARNSGRALDVAGGYDALTDGLYVQQWEYWGGGNQKWVANDAGGGYYKLKNVNSGKILSLEKEHYDENGCNVYQWTDNNLDYQLWQILDVGDGYSKIINKHSGQCLDVRGGATATTNGVPIQQWVYVGGTNQQWKFTEP